MPPPHLRARGFEIVGDMRSREALNRSGVGVYLRLNDVPVASLYGTTADEKGF